MSSYTWIVEYFIGNRKLQEIVIASTIVEALNKTVSILPNGVLRMNIRQDKEVNV